VGFRSERSEPPPPVRAAGGVGVLDPAALGVRPDEPFPQGVRVDLAPDVRCLAPGVLFGGTPPRVVRLGRRGAELLGALERGPVNGTASARLVRRLTDVGIAIPRPCGADVAHAATHDVTVVVPVRDRPAELAGCLESLGSRHRVVVVDDGSLDPAAVAAICRERGADLVRREVPGGPAAARNAGLRAVSSELVAFVDSDCLPGPCWIEGLSAHFVDPLVAGAAPRIVLPAGWRGSSLMDLGRSAAPVHPASRVPYVPAAAVVLRRAALGAGYDERLRYGEDVDLVWRLVEAGWRIRYVPDVEVAHRDPVEILQRLRRRFFYGTSVGPLARAHPGTLGHLVVGVGPACAVCCLLLGAPGLAALAWAATAAHLARRLRPFGTKSRFALALSSVQVLHAWVGLGRWCTTFGVPLLGASALGWRTRPARRARRALAVLVGSALLARLVGERGGDRRVVVDDCLGGLAYGCGVVAGCARAGVVGPLLPRIARQTFSGVAGMSRWRTPR
jgi:mycofactocin system glycosyltransferase